MAMSNAERQRRWRDKLKAAARGQEHLVEEIARLKRELEAKPQPKPKEESSDLDRLRARILELEAEIAAPESREVNELKHQLKAERAMSNKLREMYNDLLAGGGKEGLAAERNRELGAKPQSSKPDRENYVLRVKLGEANVRIKDQQTKIKNQQARIEALLAGGVDDELNRKVKSLTTANKNLRVHLNACRHSLDEERRSKGTLMTKALHKDITSCLHPDSHPNCNISNAKLTRTFQQFQGLKVTLKDE